jgi:hypothetical protein
MMREREAHANLGGELGRIVAGAEQPDRRQRGVVGHRHHVVVGVTGRKIPRLPQGQLMEAFKKIVTLATVEPAA